MVLGSPLPTLSFVLLADLKRKLSGKLLSLMPPNWPALHQMWHLHTPTCQLTNKQCTLMHCPTHNQYLHQPTHGDCKALLIRIRKYVPYKLVNNYYFHYYHNSWVGQCMTTTSSVSQDLVSFQLSSVFWV